jgi:hypothetical protein
MRLRDLFNALPDLPGDPPARPRSGDDDELLGQAASLIAAGDDAIARALSTNSEQYLASNRQEGGQ